MPSRAPITHTLPAACVHVCICGCVVVCVQVPDVDFLLHLGDGCPGGLPLVQVNINRSNPQAGFTIPLQMWAQALGPQQFGLLAECLQVRRSSSMSGHSPQHA